MNCPICFERFELHGERVPKALPCDHFICRGCIRGLSRPSCPQCLAPLHFPIDVNRLPNAVPVIRVLEGMVELTPKTKNAQTCSLPGHQGQILEAFCTVCKEAICQRCALWGHRAHELVPLDGVQDTVLASEASVVQELVKQCFKYENEAQVSSVSCAMKGCLATRHDIPFPFDITSQTSRSPAVGRLTGRSLPTSSAPRPTAKRGSPSASTPPSTRWCARSTSAASCSRPP